MTRLIVCLFCLLSFTVAAQQPDYVLLIHGGAGSLTPKNTPPERQEAYRAAMSKALDAGAAILEKGGTATDAVMAAIMVMEDDSLFNAGRGAVFTNEGKNELDASIMDGSNLEAGAVAGVTTIKNPITAARAVMDKSPHVMMAGPGAEKFAEANGCTIVDPSYFRTEKAWRSLQGVQKREAEKELKDKKSMLRQPENRDEKYGTVGAVALDKQGNLAAGTSTGGMTNKRFGRIGDSPIIGAGTYADNNSCAVSCTGWGEYFIRLGIAKSIADRVELKGMPLADAVKEMIHDKLPAFGGDGGVIAVDNKGNISVEFNTPGMNRAYITSGGKKVIEMFK